MLATYRYSVFSAALRSFFLETIDIRKKGHAIRFQMLVPLGNIYLL